MSSLAQQVEWIQSMSLSILDRRPRLQLLPKMVRFTGEDYAEMAERIEEASAGRTYYGEPMDFEHDAYTLIVDFTVDREFRETGDGRTTPYEEEETGRSLTVHLFECRDEDDDLVPCDFDPEKLIEAFGRVA